MDPVTSIALLILLVASYLAVVFGLSFTQGYKRAGMSESPLTKNKATSEFRAGGKKVVCAHCGSTRFQERQAQLNTWIATLFNFDWLNRSATALICSRCGHIMWFAQKPTPD
jgi:uncharacterized protein